MRHINIPVFIPHMGCPNDCVFCNQRKISGVEHFDIHSVPSLLKEAFSTVDPKRDEVEIAFFGGSFTGIDRDDMIYLLSLAKEYIDKDMARSIRLSTRPDYIDGEILDILEKYRVTDIELGLQSMSDKVLTASKRGHTAEDGECACRMIKERGFNLVGQMMIGLPESTAELEVMTAEKLVSLGCDGARIYPTVVFCDTELSEMMGRGEYTPLELEDAISRSCDALEVFARAGLPVIRLGLCASDNLLAEGTMVGGSYHSAMGELVYSELYRRKITAALESVDSLGKNITVYVPRGETSKAVGQKRRNITKIRADYGTRNIKIRESDELSNYNIRVEISPVEESNDVLKNT